LNPNRKVATKGGSVPGIFHKEKDHSDSQSNLPFLCQLKACIGNDQIVELNQGCIQASDLKCDQIALLAHLKIAAILTNCA